MQKGDIYMRNSLIVLSLTLALAGCTGDYGKAFVQGQWYAKLCTKVFVDDNDQPGVWSAKDRGSCTGGPGQTVYYAIAGAL